MIGRLTESIGAFTLGTGAAIGAVGAVGAAMGGKSAADFAASMRALKFGSAESGLGLTQLRQMQLTLGEFNITQDESAVRAATRSAGAGPATNVNVRERYCDWRRRRSSQ
jgi:hypothetical protein